MYKIFFMLGGIFILLGIITYIFQGNLFRLPGDIVIEKENFTLYFPVTSMIILSIIASLIFSFFNR
ncbi:MAG: DUF2905 domain-containing protein [Epsilonproteobacteria bacterium]|nr:DUF2905 domain-containing protein [Campylobacterota bacterium]